MSCRGRNFFFWFLTDTTVPDFWDFQLRVGKVIGTDVGLNLSQVVAAKMFCVCVFLVFGVFPSNLFMYGFYVVFFLCTCPENRFDVPRFFGTILPISSFRS